MCQCDAGLGCPECAPELFRDSYRSMSEEEAARLEELEDKAYRARPLKLHKKIAADLVEAKKRLRGPP